MNVFNKAWLVLRKGVDEATYQVVHFISRFIAGSLFGVFSNFRFVNKRGLPRRGEGAVIVANHQSWLDSMYFPAMFWRYPISMLAKRSIWKYKIVGAYMNRVRMFPVRGDISKDSLSRATDHVADGGKLGVFPEGTRSYDGNVHKGMLGALSVARDSGVDVWVMAIVGTDKITIKKPLTLIRPRVRFVVSDKRFHVPEFANDEDLVEIMREIMQELAFLSGKKYVDEYARKPRTAA